MFDGWMPALGFLESRAVNLFDYEDEQEHEWEGAGKFEPQGHKGTKGTWRLDSGSWIP